MDWDGSLGYAEPGLMNEAIGLAPPRAHGVRKWLPWLTAVMLEPMVRLQEEYGSYDLRAIEASRAEHHALKTSDELGRRGPVTLDLRKLGLNAFGAFGAPPKDAERWPLGTAFRMQIMGRV